MNNGQTCIAPDYVLIDARVKDEFLKEFKAVIYSYFGDDALQSPSYSRIVNDRHFKRLQEHIENAKAQHATVDLGGQVQVSENFIEPTVISNLPEDASLLEDEIFGPILPIKTYKHIQEAIDYINE